MASRPCSPGATLPRGTQAARGGVRSGYEAIDRRRPVHHRYARHQHGRACPGAAPDARVGGIGRGLEGARVSASRGRPVEQRGELRRDCVRGWRGVLRPGRPDLRGAGSLHPVNAGRADRGILRGQLRRAQRLPRRPGVRRLRRGAGCGLLMSSSRRGPGQCGVPQLERLRGRRHLSDVCNRALADQLRDCAPESRHQQPAPSDLRAEALSSAARQTDDDELLQHAQRIKARAIRRCGELLLEFQPAKGGSPHHKSTGGGAPPSRAQAARAAGLSRDQAKQALRVANVPADEFEAAVEADKPATMGRR